ncbi:unnamed protein product, partial [Ascophyllum nodosum]
MRCSPTEVHAAVVLGSAGVFQNVSRKRTAPLHKHGMANRRYYNSTGYRVVHIKPVAHNPADQTPPNRGGSIP